MTPYNCIEQFSENNCPGYIKNCENIQNGDTESINDTLKKYTDKPKLNSSYDTMTPIKNLVKIICF